MLSYKFSRLGHNGLNSSLFLIIFTASFWKFSHVRSRLIRGSLREEDSLAKGIFKRFSNFELIAPATTVIGPRLIEGCKNKISTDVAEVKLPLT